jgi:hypothetical protein
MRRVFAEAPVFNPKLETRNLKLIPDVAERCPHAVNELQARGRILRARPEDPPPRPRLVGGVVTPITIG